jgi:hypothetical protein
MNLVFQLSRASKKSARASYSRFYVSLAPAALQSG